MTKASLSGFLNTKVDLYNQPSFISTDPVSIPHLFAKKQMKDFGGMISFVLKNESDTNRVLSSTKLFALAESLGGVESLINHPATMTHASIPTEERIKNGLSDALIRLSVGIEDTDDLIEDLKMAIG